MELFELGGEKLRRSLLSVDDVDHDDHGVIMGLDYFLSHRIYVSRLQDKVYITWNGGPVFAGPERDTATYDSRYAALPRALPADDADALARRGAAALAGGDLQRALEDLNRACELAPAVADYRFTRARLHLERKDAAQALVDLDEALRLEPSLASARLQRARLQQAAGRAEEAISDLAQLDASLPPASPLRADIARLHAHAGRAAEAMKQFELWISTHPDDAALADLLNSRCWLRARLNIELQPALQDCKRAVRLDRRQANNRDSLGWVYLRLGDAAQAKEAFDDAIEIKPLAASLYGRATALRRLNDKAGSERDLAQARQLMPAVDSYLRKLGFEVLE